MLRREVEDLLGEIGSDALDLVLEPRLGEGGTQAGALGQGRRRRGGGRVRVEHDRAQTRVLTSGRGDRLLTHSRRGVGAEGEDHGRLRLIDAR